MEPMKIPSTTAIAVLAAFCAGLGVAHLPAPAGAQAAPIAAQAIDLTTIPVDKFKMLLDEDGANVAVQEGPVPKHFHKNTDEIQFFFQGTGTEWLGDKQVDIKPGVILIIPRGTAHAGQITTANGPLRYLSIHVPPQVKGDVYPVP
jgi:mannose-6-phosphate isomerase-like protein (cupin superfamily)